MDDGPSHNANHNAIRPLSLQSWRPGVLIVFPPKKYQLCHAREPGRHNARGRGAARGRHVLMTDQMTAQPARDHTAPAGHVQRPLMTAVETIAYLRLDEGGGDAHERLRNLRRRHG